MKKLSSGNYEMIYNDKKITIHTTYMEWERKSYWVFLVDNIGGDDLYKTKKEALQSAMDFIHNNR